MDGKRLGVMKMKPKKRKRTTEATTIDTGPSAHKKGERIMKHTKLILMVAFVFTISLAFGSSQTWAVGTAAGTDVNNTAEVSFTILGATTSVFNSATFKVDEKIRPVVANTDTGNQVAVLPDTLDNVLTFTITNESNTTTVNDWFEITVDDENAGETLSIYNVAIFRDTDATPGFSAGDASVADGGWVQISNASGSNTATFFVVADIRDTATAGQLDTLHLVAEAVADNSGTNLTPDGGGNDPTVSETYFADDAGVGTAINGAADDVASDAFHSASGTYVVQTPIVITKAVTDGANTGYQIPGDMVTYTITVDNNHATDSATSVTIYDAIPTYTTYNAASLSCPGGFTSGWSSDAGAPSTWVDSPSAEPGTVNHVRCSGGTIAAGGSASMSFEAFID